MIILLIFTTLLSNALNTLKERSVFYSRTTLLSLFSFSIITYNCLALNKLDNGLGLFNGLFNITSMTQTFNIFIFIIVSIILIFNSFFHINLDKKTILKNKISKNTEYKLIVNARSSESLRFFQKIINSVNKSSGINYNINEKYNKQYYIGEYTLIILFIILGSVFLMSAGDLISLFISIELQSYGLYILCTLYRDSEKSTWGGLTYFLLGGLSSCFILLGSALLYINSGTTSLDGIYIMNSLSEISLNVEDYTLLKNNIIKDSVWSNLDSSEGIKNIYILKLYDSYYINISLIMLVVGFLFKISAAPFHFWSPDVYDAIPTVVTTTVAIVAKLSLFVILLELVYYINKDTSAYSWKNTVIISSLLSLIIGSLLGLTQKRIKRVYAYSTISHIGFILLALGIDKVESIQAYIFYILTYTLSNLNAFIILIAIGYTISSVNHNNIKNKALICLPADKKSIFKATVKQLYGISQKNDSIIFNEFDDYKLQEKPNSPIQLISQLKGYFYVNPYIALSLTITLFSFVGIPPLLGFFAKQMVLSAALDNGYLFITLIAIITSVIAAVYYLNIVKQMFFFKSDINFMKYPFVSNTKYLSSPISIAISVLTLILLLFIFIPNQSFNLAKILTLVIFN